MIFDLVTTGRAHLIGIDGDKHHTENNFIVFKCMLGWHLKMRKGVKGTSFKDVFKKLLYKRSVSIEKYFKCYKCPNI